MRVAYLVNQYPKVGHSFIRREILALERQGFEVLRISLWGWDLEIADKEDDLERERTRCARPNGVAALLRSVIAVLLTRPVRLLHAAMLAWRMSLASDQPLAGHLECVAEACRILPWLSQEGVQHVHAHCETNSAEVAMLVNVLGGLPFSFTVHGGGTWENPHFLGIAEKVERCEFAVAVCSYMRGQVYRLTDYRNWRKVHEIHCGLEAALYEGFSTPAPAARRLVCVGRLCREKAQVLLLSAVQLLAAQGVDFELVLVGDGELRSEIEAQIASHKLQPLVRITGWISAERVRSEILAARALVLPSFAEGLPVPIMEAMALRRPVISTFVAGIPELVLSGQHGWLVPAGDLEALVLAMKACLDAPSDVLAKMGEAGYRRVWARHDVDAETAKLASLFHGDGQRESFLDWQG
jgi:glycosyltransferase involved in cell wall biosynthesis